MGAAEHAGRAAQAAAADDPPGALRGSLNFSKEIISDNPDDPGTSVYKSFTPANAHALRKTVLEALSAK